MRYGVTFWTEGGKNIGMGHVVRCINMAHALRAFGISVNFLVNNDPAVLEKLDAAGLSHLVMDASGANISDITKDIIVFDTKKDIKRQVRILKDEGKKIVLIDNLNCGQADAVILPSALCRPSEGEGNIFAGNEYVIIGENFHAFKSRGISLSHSLPIKVLVTMGGADPFNLTRQVLAALKDVEDIEVNVVIGPASSAHEEEELYKDSEKFIFHKNVSDMAPLIAGSHLAFTALGTTIFELAFLGVPSVIIANYKEDEQDLKEYSRLGIGIGLGYYKDAAPESIRDTVERFKSDSSLWEMVSGRAKRLSDGRGAFRIAEIIASIGKTLNHGVNISA